MGIIEVAREVNSFYYLLLIALPLLYLILKSPKNLPPGPYPWPVIGNIFSMGKKPHISLGELAKSYGPLLSLRLGTQLLVVAQTDDAAKEILKTHDKVFSARYVPHGNPLYPDRLDLSIAWTDCNDQWRYLRTLVKTELFSPKMIEGQAKIRELKVSEMVEFLRTKEGEMVNIGKLVFNVVFNMLSTIYMSKDFLAVYEENDDEGWKGVIRKIVEISSTPNLADLYTVFKPFDLQGIRKKGKEMFSLITEVWEDTVKERMENKSSDVLRQRDFLDELLERGFTKEQMDYLFQDFLFGGTDTTNSTVEWAMAELLKCRDAMKNVCAELDREIEGTSVKESDLPSLPYLHYVVKETLRLHPPAPFLLPRRASKTCKVMNYTIPKGTQIFVNVFAIARDPKTWEDPLTFKPERFLGTSMEVNSNDFTYIPFGSGRRICPGIAMANKQVPLVLASLLKAFEWSLPNNMQPADLDMEEKFGVTLQKQKSLIIIPKSKSYRA
ncbi:hypothetical protein ACHQM5_000844 [Ranunculus cassubicifolius]